MTIRFIKKTAFSGLALLFACASPMISVNKASADYQQTQRLAALISQEIPSERNKAKKVRKDEKLDVFEFARHVVRLSRDYEVDPLLVLAIIKVESGFKPTARSYVGAIGLMQVMPVVIRAVGSEVAVSNKAELYDPYKNVLLGIHYFTFLRDKYENNLQHALSAYNLGPTALDARLSRQDSVDTSYSRKVMKCYETYREKMHVQVAFLQIT
jgi:soluble lytic murein transglycosylase